LIAKISARRKAEEVTAAMAMTGIVRWRGPDSFAATTDEVLSGREDVAGDVVARVAV
jgi:hypothetical protein